MLILWQLFLAKSFLSQEIQKYTFLINQILKNKQKKSKMNLNQNSTISTVIQFKL